MKKTRKILCTLMAVLMCLTSVPLGGLVGLDLSQISFGTTKASALSSSGTCGDNVNYTYDNSTGLLTISGTGEMKNYSSYNSSPFYNSDIKSVVIESGVTSIGGYAFYRCTSLTSITIPDSVTSIGGYAFWGCTSLTSVTIPDSVTSIGNSAFSWCTSLTSVTIPDSVTSIGSSVFSGCTGLTSVTIPDSVTSIGGYTFSGCTSLTSVTIPDSVTSIGGYTFSGCTRLTSVTIPDSVTSIGSDAFYGCTGLTSVTIPDSVTSIGGEAFSGCTGLTSITVDSNNTKYSSDSYGVLFNKDKTELIQYPIGNTRTSYTIPDSVTSIGSSAFEYCTGLTSVTIPDSVTSIGSSAFYGCDKLVAVYISDIAVWCNIKFSYDANPLSNGANLYLNGGLVTDLVIPNSVTSIGDYAFRGCTGLTSVTIPDSVTSIGSYAFCVCTGLTSVTIGNGVTSIGSSAFYGCDKLAAVYISDIAVWCNIKFSYGANPLSNVANLYLNGGLVTDLVIPNSVTSIGDYAFYRCTSLTSVTIPDSVTSIGDSAFYRCTGLTSVTIPDSVTSIGEDAFNGCTGLTSITIGDGVTSIGSSAFYGCDKLAAVYISDIAAWCNISFSDETASPLYNAKNLYLNDVLLTNLEIPNGTTSIKSYAFYNCISLENVTIPDSVTSIGVAVFNGCSSLKNITVDENNEHYLSDNSGALYDKAQTNLIAYPVKGTQTSYAIPNTVTAIGDYAFYNCPYLESISIPDSVTSIGKSAFYGCKSLKSMTISDNVTSIGDEALYECDNIEYISVPMNLNYSKVIPLDASEVTIGNGRVVFKWSKDTIMTTLNIGADVTEKDIEVLHDIIYLSLEKINLDEGNEYLSIVDDVLYNKDITTMLLYPIGAAKTSYVMPDTVVWTRETNENYNILFFALDLKSITIGANFNIGFGSAAAYDNFFDNFSTDEENIMRAYMAGHYIFGFGDGASGQGLYLFSEHLEEIKVSPNHHYLKGVDGVLYLKDDNYDVILAYPGAKGGDIKLDANNMCYDFAFIAPQDGHKVEISDGFYNNYYDLAKTQFSNNETVDDTEVKKKADKYFNNFLYYLNTSEFAISQDSELFYTDEYGALYNKDKTELIKFPSDSDAEFYVFSDDLKYNSLTFVAFTPITMSLYYPKNTVIHFDGKFDDIPMIPCKTVCVEIDKDEIFVTEIGEDGEEITHTYGEFVELYNESIEKAIAEYNKMFNFDIEAGLESNNKYSQYMLDYTIKTMEGLFSSVLVYLVPLSICEGHDGHTHTNADPVKENEVPSTCQKAGSYDEVIYCTECGKEVSRKTIPLSKLDHNYTTTQVDATCTTPGSITYTCTCGDTYTDTISATGHKLGSWYISTPATVFADGEEKCDCANCNYYETRKLAKLTNDIAKDETTGVSITYTADSFEKIPTVVVSENNDEMENANFVLGCFGKFKAFSISLEVGGEKVQPNGKVTVKLPIPAGYDAASTEAYYVNENNELVKLDCYIKGGYLIFETDHFSVYAIVDESTEIHVHNYEISAQVDATCTTPGSITYTCTCGDSYSEPIQVISHIDSNADTYCDVCGTDLNPQAHCTCNCHKTGIVHFFFVIANFFEKLFGNNKVCACGAEH